MPEKLSPYASYGEKLIRLFARLLFTGKAYSLGELSRSLGCSKQTVLRLIEDIRRSFGAEIEEHTEGRQKYYRIRRHLGSLPAMSLSYSEIEVLLMCQAFARHLLGRSLFGEATAALEKNLALIRPGGAPEMTHFTSYTPGSIDYSAHEASIRTLLNAMEQHLVCTVTYRSLTAWRAKTFSIMPLKIFSHHDTVYLCARYAGKPGQPHRTREYDPLLAIHRIRGVELTDRPFVFPPDFDFEHIFNRNFGIIKQAAFEVEVEFSAQAARYVSERTWSPDQKVWETRDGRVRLIFSASSRSELLAWLLSFGAEARLIRPAELIDEIRETLARMQRHYAPGA